VVTTKTRNLERAARWFHALADETRLCIIDCLTGGERCVCDLTDLLHTGQSRLSFHLKTLKDAGIVQDRREGRWVYYSLNPETIEELHQVVASIKEGSEIRISSRSCE
jgi:ArsR family transcriptional regulator, arsenate/arsenite/antimonite-responsive transcriptional repressor